MEWWVVFHHPPLLFQLVDCFIAKEEEEEKERTIYSRGYFSPRYNYKSLSMHREPFCYCGYLCVCEEAMRMATPFASRQQQTHTLSLSWIHRVLLRRSSTFNYNKAQLWSRKKKFCFISLFDFGTREEKTKQGMNERMNEPTQLIIINGRACASGGWWVIQDY